MACSSVNLIPGPQGASGTNGAAGTNGDNAWTTTTANFTMPAEGANVTVNVADSDMLTSGDTVYVQGAGYMSVQSVPSTTQVVLQNLENTANLAYTANVAPGTVIASGAKIVPGGVQGPAGSQRYALIQHQLATGTNAGDFNSGANRTVPLNTEVVDTGGDVSVAANQVTVAAGTYRCRWGVIGYQVNSFVSWLQNITAGTTLQWGSAARSAAADGVTAWSLGEYRFTVAASTVFELQARCETSNAGDGFGIASNLAGATEVYAWLELEREI